MKPFTTYVFLALVFLGCGGAPETAPSDSGTAPVGQSGVQDPESEKNILNVAAGSPDHTTLVAAVTAAGLADALVNAGPFTVFAPVNGAFDKLPKGTVEDLLKPENKGKLKTILYHHVTTSAYTIEMLGNGQTLGMVDGSPAAVTKRGDDLYIDDARILGTVKASNGIVHVVDAVILPPSN